jgi:hypothetical protein
MNSKKCRDLPSTSGVWQQRLKKPLKTYQEKHQPDIFIGLGLAFPGFGNEDWKSQRGKPRANTRLDL